MKGQKANSGRLLPKGKAKTSLPLGLMLQLHLPGVRGVASALLWKYGLFSVTGVVDLGGAVSV